MNPLRDRVDLQVLRLGVEQDQVGLEMQRGVERTRAVTFLPDQVLPAGFQGRADHRRQMRLVIDQQDAFGRAHVANEFPEQLLAAVVPL